MFNQGFQLESLEPRTLLAAQPMTEVRVHFEVTDSAANPQRQLVYLADASHWKISAINTDQARHVAQSPKLAGRPRWLAVSPDGSRVFVTEPAERKIQVLDAVSLKIVRTMNLDFIPREFVVGANNRLYMRSDRSSSVDDILELNASTGQPVQVLAAVRSAGMYASNDGRRLYIMGDTYPAHDQPLITTYDTSTLNVDAAAIDTHAGGYGQFAIDQQYHRAYVLYGGFGGMRVFDMESTAVDTWSYPAQLVEPRDLAVKESGGSVFVQIDFGAYGIREFRRSDGAVLADYPTTVYQSESVSMDMTGNGRVVFVKKSWVGNGYNHYVGIIGSAQLKAEDTPPVPKLTATAYSSHNFLFDASASLAGAGDETITRYRWELGDGTQETGGRLYHTYASAGTYEVRLTVTDSNGDSKSITTTVTAGNTTNTASISGRVFKDSNYDGKANEFGVGEYQQGRVVFIDLNGDRKRQATEPTATTDQRGNYALLGLAAGTYRVYLVRDQNEAVTAPRLRGWTVTLSGGQQYTARNFGYVYMPAQEVMVFSDLNANEVFDVDEPVFANRTVWLDANNNLLLDAGEATYKTDSRGQCKMLGLMPGKHIVRTVVAPGERLMRSYTMKVTPYGVNNIYLAVRPRGTSTLGGFVFDDPNFDGVQQPRERALAGHTVFHDIDRDGVFDIGEPSALSDANGHYRLTGLDAGVQMVGIAPARKWRASTAIIRNQRDALLYQGGLDNRHIGVSPRPLVLGSVFFDTNNNGLFDTRIERGLPDRTIFADLDGDGVFDKSDEPHVLTDSQGGYRFDLQSSGTYTIRLVPQAGHFAIAPAHGYVAVVFKSGQVRSFPFAESLGTV